MYMPFNSVPITPLLFRTGHRWPATRSQKKTQKSEVHRPLANANPNTTAPLGAPFAVCVFTPSPLVACFQYGLRIPSLFFLVGTDLFATLPSEETVSMSSKCKSYLLLFCGHKNKLSPSAALLLYWRPKGSLYVHSSLFDLLAKTIMNYSLPLFANIKFVFGCTTFGACKTLWKELFFPASSYK